jgi:GT2 family glycosyltransferase
MKDMARNVVSHSGTVELADGYRRSHSKSIQLSIVLGTLNRLEQLKKCLESIFRETHIPLIIFVADAGSTDGTVDFLKGISGEQIIPVLMGEKLGQARAYNEIFDIIDSPYVCWLSDDDLVINNGLERALEILQSNPRIGMVGLKTKDLVGPFSNAPYIGGISSIGVLNVNQGMLPTALLKEMHGFSEEFMDYGIDPDLTTRVLMTGKQVVYTKKIALNHLRNWPVLSDSQELLILKKRHEKYIELYKQKYQSLDYPPDNQHLFPLYLKKMGSSLGRLIIRGKGRQWTWVRDWYNILNSRYISFFDFIYGIGKKCHLRQEIPDSLRQRHQL